MPEWVGQLEESGFASIARESLYGFQILVAIHILGIVLSVGTLLWVDLRMLGLCLDRQSVAAVYRSLSGWFVAGFAVMFVTGAMLFAGFATLAYDNTFFRVKLAVIVLAGVNAIAFHIMLGRMSKEAVSRTPPAPVRLAGFLSIAFWLTAILCGRMMSYTLF